MALERRAALTDQPIEQFAHWAFRDLDHRKLFQDGIALAKQGGTLGVGGPEGTA